MHHLWGQFKSRAHSVIVAAYGFDTSVDDNAIEHNQALFMELKQDSAFIFRVCAMYSLTVHVHKCKKTCGKILNNHAGIYMTTIIQQVINAVLFKNKNKDGIQWATYYISFPVVRFALMITAVGFDS